MANILPVIYERSNIPSVPVNNNKHTDTLTLKGDSWTILHKQTKEHILRTKGITSIQHIATTNRSRRSMSETHSIEAQMFVPTQVPKPN